MPSPSLHQVRVLVKEPKGREVGDGDTFSFYSDFSEKQYRIKINSIQMKETEEENKKTHDEVGARGRGGGKGGTMAVIRDGCGRGGYWGGAG